MNRTAAKQKLIAHTAAQTTGRLMAGLKILDAMPQSAMRPEHRITYATICDVLEQRLELHEYVGDIIEAEPIDSDISYCKAIEMALAQANA